MRSLTETGATKVGDVARRNGVSPEAARTVLDALDRGGGSQAQFSHPDLGGMGQWSRGGMIMVGDMFNSRLKAQVDQLCTDLSDLLRDDDLFPTDARGAGGDHDHDGWWPAGCGIPALSGSQNDMRYAYFPDTRRLAIERDGAVSLYDTGDHRISGVSQQQSGTRDLAFTSQHGPVKLHDLKRLDEAAPSRAPKAAPVERAKEPDKKAPDQEETGTKATSPVPGSDKSHDVFATIERLHGLQQKGILSDAEFAEKKKELLARL